jgi:imidazolonepropionase-like amidohydrolase
MSTVPKSPLGKEADMSIVILENARLFDGTSENLREGVSVAVEGEVIKEVSNRAIKGPNARRIDLAGRTLMPGLIDLHIHAYICGFNSRESSGSGRAYQAAFAAKMLGHSLDCGFTTLRDIGGGDWSLARALSAGLIRGPRFFYVGKMLSMTGGHGDSRPMSVEGHSPGAEICNCGQVHSLTVIADGVDQCIQAAREQFRRGAHAIKIMAGGGALSPADPLWMNQYREDEIRAIVEECRQRRTYVSAHVSTADGIRRCVEFGVRCIEHGHFIDDETAAYVVERGAYVVPTLAVIYAMSDIRDELGISDEMLEKLDYHAKEAYGGLERMRKAGISVGFGTDLLGKTYVRQCTEFTLRREVFTPIEILRQATSMGAEILQMKGKLGCVAPDAFADLIVVDGDPTKDIGLLAQDGRALSMIMRNGELVKNKLD